MFASAGLTALLFFAVLPRSWLEYIPASFRSLNLDHIKVAEHEY